MYSKTFQFFFTKIFLFLVCKSCAREAADDTLLCCNIRLEKQKSRFRFSVPKTRSCIFSSCFLVAQSARKKTISFCVSRGDNDKQEVDILAERKLLVPFPKWQKNLGISGRRKKTKKATFLFLFNLLWTFNTFVVVLSNKR